jgi:glycosyltransferase involved in cell wall biosynthesis
VPSLRSLRRARRRAPAVRGAVCVVGPGTRFLSGITYYTYGLCNALAERRPTSALLIRQMLPTRLYPGRLRVGSALSEIRLRDEIQTFDGIDWYWLPSLPRALAFLRRREAEFLLLEWWTGTVLHSYLALAAVARLHGTRIVVEFHEALDTGEAEHVWVDRYVRALSPLLFRMAEGFVVHSEFDRALVRERLSLPDRPIVVIPHATYDNYAGEEPERAAPAGVCNILFFGVIRPFKGLEDLVEAFSSLPRAEAERFWLTVVGETWEGWETPAELIERSPHRDRITFVNRYVEDREVGAFFAGADVVALPYHRSSQSGPLHVAMHHGLPVVITGVGGLIEAVEGYEGAIVVPPHDPPALRDALEQAEALAGTRFANPRDWAYAAERFDAFLGSLGEG